MMEFFIENLLILVVHISLFAANVAIGILGLHMGEYFRKKKAKTFVSFQSIQKQEFKELIVDYKNNDPSILVMSLIFGHLGLLFFFLVLFGPVGEDKYKENSVDLK